MGIKKLIIFQLLISMGLSLVPVLSYAQPVVGSLPVNKLIREKGGIRVYVLNEFGYKRHIANPEVFNSYGFKWEDIAEVSIVEMDNYSESLLIREANDTKVYFIEDGKKRWVNSAESFAGHNFDWKKVHVINDTDIKAYTIGDTVAVESTIRETTSALPIRAPRKADAPVSDSGKPDLRITAPKKSDLPNKLEEAPKIKKETVLKKEVSVPFISGGGGTLDTNLPATITDLAATNPTTSSVELTWTAPTGIVAWFDVRYSTTPRRTGMKWSKKAIRVDEVSVGGDPQEPLPYQPGAVYVMTISRLSSGTTYYFDVQTVDEASNRSKGLSNSASVTTISAPDSIPPSAIADLTISGSTFSSVELTWTAPGDDGSTGTATSYDVLYSPRNITDTNWRVARQATGVPTPQEAGSSQSVIISALSGGTYYFALKTKDEAPNWSGLSNVVNAVFASDTTAPSSIIDISASSVSLPFVTLSWTAPGDDGSLGTATSYDVRYSTSITNMESNWSSATQATGEPAPQVAGTSQSMTISGLSSEITYHFAIKTKDEAGNESPISDIASTTPIILPDTTAPSIITSLTASNPTTNSVTLSWTAPGDDGSLGTATSYDVRYSTSITTMESNWSSATQATGEPAPQVAGTSQSMTISGLSSEITYHFAIKTKDEVPNESGLYNTASLTTLPPDTTAPAAIDTFSSSNPTTNSITLSWRSPGDDVNTGTATSYDIRHSQSIITDANWSSATQATGEPAPQVAWSSQSMTISGLASGTTYYFAIKTSDEVSYASGISNVVNRATIACVSLVSGSQTFSVRSGPGQPQIQRIILDPLDYQTGSSQTITVKARDTNRNSEFCLGLPCPITSVSVAFTTDSGTTTVSLSHSSGSTTSGYWSASWTPTDTHCVTYSVAIIATSASGTSQSTLSPQ